LIFLGTDYKEIAVAEPLSWPGTARPGAPRSLSMDSREVALGPLLQAIVGLALAVILYPFKDTFLDGGKGWARLILLIGGFTFFAP
jgi:hypothetical protein